MEASAANGTKMSITRYSVILPSPVDGSTDEKKTQIRARGQQDTLHILPKTAHMLCTVWCSVSTSHCLMHTTAHLKKYRDCYLTGHRGRKHLKVSAGQCFWSTQSCTPLHCTEKPKCRIVKQYFTVQCLRCNKMQLKVAFQPSEKNWVKICITNVLLVAIQGTQYSVYLVQS